jgi:MYXO-CTERM domain-containing protein
MAPFTIGAGSSPELTIGEISTDGTCVSITGSVADPDGETPAVTVSVDDSYDAPVVVDDAGAWSFERCQLGIGDHQASVKAVDAAGLQDQETVAFSITGTTEDDPEISIDQLETNLDCMHLKGTAADPNGERLAVTVKIDSGSPNPVNLDDQGSFSYDRCLLEEGTHTLTILAINRSGLRATVEEQFEIAGGSGGGAPVVAIQKVTVDAFCARLQGTVTDPDGDAVTVTVTVDGGATEGASLGAGGAWSYDWCGKRGDHAALVRAEDPAGHAGTATVDFHIKGASSGCSTTNGGDAWIPALLLLLALVTRRGR